MARTKIPKIKIAGIGSIPAGYMLGRVEPGVGDVQLISITRAAQAIARTGVVSSPGQVSVAATATLTSLGSVQPDGVTITITAGGVISIVPGKGAMLPLVTGDTTPGGQPFFVTDGVGQCIGVPL